MGATSFFDYPGEAVAAESTEDQAVLLPDLDEDGWERLISYTQARRISQGETVIAAGARDRSLYIVADGVLALDTPAGTVTLRSGAVLGELSFFDGLPRSQSVRARTDVDLLMLGQEAFEVLSAREPVLARALLFDLGRILALRLRRAQAT